MEYASAFSHYRDIDSQRVATWVKRLTRLFPSLKFGKFADLGCGSGRFTVPLQAFCTYVTGIDKNPNMLKIAASRSSAIEWLNRDVLDTGLPAGTFDTVLTSMVMEHIGEKPKMFREIHRLLKPGGHWLLRTMLPEDIDNTTWYQFSTIARDKEIQRTVSLKWLKQACLETGFSLSFIGSYQDIVHETERQTLDARLEGKSYQILHDIDSSELTGAVEKARQWQNSTNQPEIKSSSLILIHKLENI